MESQRAPLTDTLVRGAPATVVSRPPAPPVPLEVADGDEPFEPLPCAVDDGVVQRFYEFDVAWQPEPWVKSLLDQVSVDARAKPRIVINVIEDHAVPHGQPDTTVVVDVVCCANADGLTDYNTENYWEGFQRHGKWHGKWWQHEDQPKRSCKWCGYDTYQRKGVCTNCNPNGDRWW